MPNRVLREGALHSRSLNRCSRDSEWLFYRLLQVADDFGLFEADPYSIKSKAAGARDEVTVEQLEAWRDELAENELILLYEHETRILGAMNKWNQRRFATRPKYPMPPWGDTHILGGYVDPRVRPGYEPPSKRKSIPKKMNGTHYEPQIPDWIPSELYLQWWKAKAVRARTAGAHALAVKRLAEFKAAGQDPRVVLEHCVIGGFAGIYAPSSAKVSQQAAAPVIKCGNCGDPITGGWMQTSHGRTCDPCVQWERKHGNWERP